MITRRARESKWPRVWAEEWDERRQRAALAPS
jgi:hypothetical protein